MSIPQQSHKHQTTLPMMMWALILMLATLAHVTADIYLPSLPSISKDLNSNAANAQLTLSIYLLGFAISHLFYGPISDRIGRKKPMLFGIGLSIIGGVICLSATNMALLILGRFIQGCGVGACNAIVRSLMRDLFSGNQLAKLGSQMGMLMVLITAMAPTIGGYIQHFFTWHGIFFFIVGYTFLIWVLVLIKLPETNNHLNQHATKINVMLKNYGALLMHKTFMGYTICMSCAYAGMLAYLTQASFLLQNLVGLTPVEFGWTSFIIGGAFFISAFVNSRMVMAKGISYMTLLGISLILLSSILLIGGSYIGWISVFSIIGAVTIFCFGCGFSFSNASAGALHPFPGTAGSAAAMFGFIQVITASLVSSITALLHQKSQMPLGIILLILGLISLIAWKYLATKAIPT